MKVTNQMIKYLEKRINCENVIKFVEKKQADTLGSGLESTIIKLIINEIPVALKVLKYNDSPGYVYKNKTDPNDKTWIQNIFDVYDFMTESNYTGFEYFPYLYGVLNCHDGLNSKVYTFYEVFDGDLINLISKMEHQSEWYDIVFQMIMINYYIEIINGYRYNDGTPQNHLYRKLPKPYYKLYDINGVQFNISHKYLIVLWDISYMEKITIGNKSKVTSNISFLSKYLTDNNTNANIPVPPGPKITKLLEEINNSPQNTVEILGKYYPATKQSNTNALSTDNNILSSNNIISSTDTTSSITSSITSPIDNDVSSGENSD